jgi:hypothetical protein
LIIFKYSHGKHLNYSYRISKINTDFAFIEAFKSYSLRLPGYEQALAKVELKNDSIQEKSIDESEIKIITTYIDDGYLIFIDNPEHSHQGFNCGIYFKTTNLVIQGQPCGENELKVKFLMPGENRLVRFETIVKGEKKKIKLKYTHKFL